MQRWKYIVRTVSHMDPVNDELLDEGPPLAVHVKCARCRYDLTGARPLGRCPECGLEIVVTLAQNSDPEISDLARPERPRLASFGVLALALGPFMALCIQGVSPTLRFIDSLTGRGAAFPSQVERPAWLAAGVVLLAAAIVAGHALGSRTNPTLRATCARFLLRTQCAMWAWCAVLLAGFAFSFAETTQRRSYALVVLAMQLLPATLCLAWMGAALSRIGVHSRAFREARQGRQSSELVTVTLAAAITLGIIRPALEPLGHPELYDISGILSHVLIVLSVLGLAYMVANAWVISAALRRPRLDPRRLM